MKERPILFNPDMVRAIIEGRKTQTRRTRNIPQDFEHQGFMPNKGKWGFLLPNGKTSYRQCPYGVSGDRLWVREAWKTAASLNDKKPAELDAKTPIFYPANEGFINPDQMRESFGAPRAAFYMPRILSRITLKITAVGIERLQAISTEGALSEGIESWITLRRQKAYRNYDDQWSHYSNPEHSFASLWDSVNSKKEGQSWHDDPWVWVISFEVLEVRS